MKGVIGKVNFYIRFHSLNIKDSTKLENKNHHLISFPFHSILPNIILFVENHVVTAVSCILMVSSFEPPIDTIDFSMQLSGGEKQRVALARAFLKAPTIL